MAEGQASQIKFPDPSSVSQTMASIAERSQNIVADFLARQVTADHRRSIDPLNLGSAFFEMTTRMMASPDKMLQARIFSYADVHRYRLGTHYEALPINAPKCPMNHYHKVW